VESRESGGAGAGESFRFVVALAAIVLATIGTHRSAGEEALRKSLVAEP